jgi:hypothetical protein
LKGHTVVDEVKRMRAAGRASCGKRSDRARGLPQKQFEPKICPIEKRDRTAYILYVEREARSRP